MQNNTARAEAPRNLNAQLARYAPRQLGNLKSFAGEHSSCSDLLWSFPAAAVALSTGFAETGERNHARALIARGAPLKDIARALHLPLWLRRAPPELLHHGLPETLSMYFIDTAFGRRAAPAIPKQCPPGSRWLPLVQDARFACGDEYALWLATRRETAIADIPTEAARTMAAFAWHSTRPWLIASSFIDAPWTARSTFHTAMASAAEWLQKLCLECRQAPPPAEPCAHTRVNGFEFVPLLSAAALREEAVIMRNCLAGYSERVLLGWSKIYSVRRADVRVACVELTPDAGGLPDINELAGPRNGPAGQDVRDAISCWLALLRRTDRFAPSPLNAIKLDSDAWRALWRPYWAGVGSLAPCGPYATLAHVTNALQRLYRGASVILPAAA